MKILVSIAVLALSAPAFAAQIQVPRRMPAIAVTQTSAIEKYLVSLIEETEETPVGGPLSVYTGAAADECTSVGNRLECSLDYLNDRWNGKLTAQFELSADGRTIVQLVRVDVEGSY